MKEEEVLLDIWRTAAEVTKSEKNKTKVEYSYSNKGEL